MVRWEIARNGKFCTTSTEFSAGIRRRSRWEQCFLKKRTEVSLVTVSRDGDLCIVGNRSRVPFSAIKHLSTRWQERLSTFCLWSEGNFHRHKANKKKGNTLNQNTYFTKQHTRTQAKGALKASTTT